MDAPKRLYLLKQVIPEGKVRTGKIPMKQRQTTKIDKTDRQQNHSKDRPR